MSRFVEFVKYRLKATSEEEFLQFRSVAVTAVRAAIRHSESCPKER